MDEVSRIGVYGIYFEKSAILLVSKKSGPYRGKLDLPGGGIEFGETPEQALRREFLEETALSFQSASLFQNLSHLGIYDGENFYHLGMIYRVFSCLPAEHREAEDDFHWVSLEDLKRQNLTPFAKYVADNLKALL